MAKQIQWFPGHMFKSLREMREKMSQMDIIMVLLDARIPYASMNPEIKKMTGNKPVLLIFNKMDLSDPKDLNKWESYYQNQGYYTLKIDAQSGKNVDKIYPLVKKVLDEKLKRRETRGLKEVAFNTMIVGIPNVGKSTLINQIAKAKATKTANTPGVTKSQQWVRMGDHFNLLDTPGVLWPKFEDESVGLRLAVTGSIKDQILPIDDVVCYALSFLKDHYLNRLIKRYPTIENHLESCHTMLDAIGEMRKAYLNKNEYDYERIYQIVLRDLRNNEFGGLCFEKDLPL